MYVIMNVLICLYIVRCVVVVMCIINIIIYMPVVYNICRASIIRRVKKYKRELQKKIFKNTREHFLGHIITYIILGKKKLNSHLDKISCFKKYYLTSKNTKYILFLN